MAGSLPECLCFMCFMGGGGRGALNDTEGTCVINGECARAVYSIWHVCKGLAARESQQINNFYNDIHITGKMTSILVNTAMNVRVELYHNYALGKLIFTTRQWASIKIFKLGVPVTYCVRIYVHRGTERHLLPLLLDSLQLASE
jgi:hypothetical protein